METPLRLRRLAGLDKTGDFSGFENENRGTTKRLMNVVKEVRFMKELLEGMMMKYEVIEKKIRKCKFFSKYRS